MTKKQLTQEEVLRAHVRRQIVRYEAEEMDGLIDKRIEQVLQRQAPTDEVATVVGY